MFVHYNNESIKWYEKSYENFDQFNKIFYIWMGNLVPIVSPGVLKSEIQVKIGTSSRL